MKAEFSKLLYILSLLKNTQIEKNNPDILIFDLLRNVQDINLSNCLFKVTHIL